jgi:hypothetical protein
VWLVFTDVPPAMLYSHRRSQKAFCFQYSSCGKPVALRAAMSFRIFGITKPGMAALAGCVAVLWTCFGLEIAVRRTTSHDAAATLRTIAELRHRTQDRAVTTPVRNQIPTTPPRTFTS